MAATQEELAIVWRAVKQDDLRHAIEHLARVLAQEPEHPEGLALLDALDGRGVDPQVVAPLDQHAWFGLVAVHAWLLRRRDLGAAIDLVFQVTATRPDVPYLRWVSGWLRQRVPQDRWEVAFLRLLPVLGEMPVPLDETDPRRATLDGLVQLAASVREQVPRVVTVLQVTASALRRLGRFDQAIEWAAAAYRVEPSWTTAVGLATALREHGDVDAALAAYRRALTHDPSDETAWLDIGDLCLEEDRLMEALDAYEAVLASDPQHAWARPHVLFIRARLGSEQARLELEAWSAEHPDDEHPTSLLAALDSVVGRGRSN